MASEQGHPVFATTSGVATTPAAASRLKAGGRALRIPRTAWRWFVIAFAVRLVAALLIHFYSLSVGLNGFYPLVSGADDITYWAFALEIYAGHAVQDVPNVYPYFLSALFHLVGPDLLVGKLVNVVAGALTVYVGVLCVQTLARGQMSKSSAKWAARWAGGLLTFYPSLLFYSTQLVKDPILVLSGVCALYLAIRLLRAPRIENGVLWVAAMFVLYLFRPYAAFAVALSLLLFTVRFKPKWLVATLVIVGVAPYALGLGWFGTAYFVPKLNAEALASFRESQYSVGGSAAGITVDYSNPIRFLITYSYSFATVMFGPFPWQLSASGQIIALPEALGMLLLSPIWARGVFGLLRGKLKTEGKTAMLLLLLSLVLIGVIAVFSDNIGANTRLRLLPWSAFLLYAALQMPRLRFR